MTNNLRGWGQGSRVNIQVRGQRSMSTTGARPHTEATAQHVCSESAMYRAAATGLKGGGGIEVCGRARGG